MPAHKPHSPSYSLDDLVLVLVFVEFVLSMAAAVLCVITMAYCSGIRVIWSRLTTESKKNGCTRCCVNEVSDGRQTVVETRVWRKCLLLGKDGQANVDQGVIAANPLEMTDTNTPSSIHKHSMYSSASNESPASSEIANLKARSQFDTPKEMTLKWSPLLQEHIEATRGGDYVAVGQQIPDSPLMMRNTDVTPSTGSWTFGEASEGDRREEERVEVFLNEK
ncbi:hypothetical protein BDP27DRAFT_1368223 [Rhodocollybia butyracea]|uniref:Uncharacterized protein n=1 Tax=Rhodocollybia butyracea TaxID=206335 RepID=A0A9P5PHA3_9AGAR|nr:hypothetical protein BDP27DRAFT_1368223 [Rhodocollybia butyracea]